MLPNSLISHAAFFPLPSSRIHRLIPKLLGPVIVNGKEKGMSLFSLLIFSITKNCPRTDDIYVSFDHPTLVPANGWTQLTGSHPSLPSISAPDTGQERHPSPVVDLYLGNQGFMRPCRRRHSSTARRRLSLQTVPCQGHSHPRSASLRFKPKAVFLCLKKKEKKSKN